MPRSNTTPAGSTLARAQKNGFINGNYDFWQRGISQTVAVNAGSTYLADRWVTLYNTDGGGAGISVGQSQQSFAVGQTEVPNAPTFYDRHLISATGAAFGANGIAYHGQRIENVTSYAGKTITWSFWARSSIASKQINVCAGQQFGTGGSAYVGISPIGGATTTLSSGWTKYTFKFSIPSIAGKTIGTNSSLEMLIILSQGATSAAVFGSTAITLQGTGTIDFAQHMVNEGDFAAPFTGFGMSIEEELAACQRYYEKSYTMSDAPGTNTSAGTSGIRGLSGAAPYHMTIFRVEKRTIPTITYYDWVGAVNRIRTNGVNGITLNGSVQSATGSFMLIHNTTVSEIFFNWVADAEL